MEHVLAGLHWTSCLVYLDDIIIFSQTISDHLQKLQEVLARLQKAGLKIKPSKCFLMQRSVHYLGHVVSAKGVETDPKKVSCVWEWPIPTDVKELQQFLGLASHYRRFVKNFAHKARPLHRPAKPSLNQNVSTALPGKRCWLWSGVYANFAPTSMDKHSRPEPITIH